jgi:hypothetical protein
VVATNGGADAFFDGFVRFVGRSDFEVGGLASIRQVRPMHEVHGVGAGGQAWEIPLVQASKFVGAGIFPKGALVAL